MTDRVTAIILVLFGGAVVVESWRMPRFESIGGTIHNAPGLVPGLLGAIIAVMGGLMLARTYMERQAPPAPENASGTALDAAAAAGTDTAPEAAPDAAYVAAHEAEHADGEKHVEPPSAGYRRFAWILGLSLVYAAGLVGRVPFWLATFLFVFAAIVVFERSEYKSRRMATRRLIVAAVIAGATAFAVPFVFERIFLVNLP